MAAFIRSDPPDDPRRPVAAARLRSLQLRWREPVAGPAAR
jgi:hypothetical protein